MIVDYRYKQNPAVSPASFPFTKNTIFVRDWTVTSFGYKINNLSGDPLTTSYDYHSPRHFLVGLQYCVKKTVYDVGVAKIAMGAMLVICALVCASTGGAVFIGFSVLGSCISLSSMVVGHTLDKRKLSEIKKYCVNINDSVIGEIYIK